MSDDNKLKKYLDEFPDIKKRYELNQKLINFDYIPEKLVKLALSKFIQLNLTPK
jgi:hypothetical protein